MQIDFHYYTIKVLSRFAGFSNREAQIIAYASQYVDDATAHKKLYFSHPLQTKFDRYNKTELSFDPICTAHKGLNFLKGISNSAQRDIYIPFHFIPAEQYLCQDDYTYVTKPNSVFANELLEWARQPLLLEKTDRALIKLGIALHTYADTWAHQNFSGIHCSKDNDVTAIQFKKNQEWEKTASLKNLLGNLFPDIGHVEAFDFPDRAYLSWKYENATGSINRNNTELFLEAAQNIHSFLCHTNNHPNKWNKIYPHLKDCFALETKSIAKKADKFIDLFPEVKFKYKPKKWKRLAIKKEVLDWETSDKYYLKTKYKCLNDIKWFLFHEEAYEQRLYITNRIKLF